MGRPKLYENRIKLALPTEMMKRIERVRGLRACRLGLDQPTADILREAVAVGLAQLERVEEQAVVGDRMAAPTYRVGGLIRTKRQPRRQNTSDGT